MKRGDYISKDVNQAFKYLKKDKTIRFVDWNLNEFKIGINYSIPTVIPGGELDKAWSTLRVIGNSSAISSVFSELSHKFDLMYGKRAFVHQYVSEGMEEDQFQQAKESIAALEKDYQEMSKDDNQFKGEEQS